MPVKHIQRSVAAAASKIRKSWTHEERVHREAQATQMQLRLLKALGLAPALAPARKVGASA